MKYTGHLSVLAQLIQDNRTDFRPVSLLVVQHIKKNTVEFIRLLREAGFRDITLIGKPYSVDKEALKAIQSYAKVVMPTFTQLERVTYIGLIINKVIRKQPFICLDLGGHFSKYFQSLSASPKGLIGVIEETKNGIWFDPAALKIPLFSVAQAHLKNYGEVYFVARAILRSTENILVNEFQQTLAGKNILLLGYGLIGNSLAPMLQREARVTVYDLLPSLRLKARINGLHVLNSPARLSEFDVVIGTTGAYALKHELISLKHGAILVNGSTRKREFDFRTITKHIEGKVEEKVYTKYTLTSGKVLYLLAHGYPVNFFETESVPEYILDLLYSEMFLLCQELIKKRYNPGFYRIEEHFADLEEIVAAQWLLHWEN